MKLLRIVSEEGQRTARIDAVFNDNLIIAPHSKIALINAIVNLADDYLQVDDTNNSLVFQTKATSGNRSVTLPNGNFTPTKLAIELEQAMNKALINDLDTPNSVDMGFMWAASIASISTGNKLKIEFKRSDLKVLDMANKTANMAEGGVSPDFTYTKTGADAWDSYAVTNSVFTRGAGMYQAKINEGTAASMKFVMGLTNNPNPLTYADYKYAIAALDGSDKYQIIVDGAIVEETTVDVLDGESVQILLANNTLSFMIALSPLHIRPDFNDYGSSYKMGFSIRNAGDYISSPKAHIDPYIVAGNSELLSVNATKVSLIFNKNTKHLLGFHNNDNDVTTIAGQFVATEPISTGGKSPSMICEIGLPLDSFDSKLHKKRNIVAVMPNLNKINNNLIYEAHYPLFISLHNASTLLLNNLQVRLLDQSDEEEIALDVAGCALTFGICG